MSLEASPLSCVAIFTSDEINIHCKCKTRIEVNRFNAGLGVNCTGFLYSWCYHDLFVKPNDYHEF